MDAAYASELLQLAALGKNVNLAFSSASKIRNSVLISSDDAHCPKRYYKRNAKFSTLETNKYSLFLIKEPRPVVLAL
jgi:hypothetical protein